MAIPILHTTAQVAKIRGRTTQALTMERQRGEGPPYIVDGGRILYPEDGLEKWFAEHRVDPALVPKPRRSRRSAVAKDTVKRDAEPASTDVIPPA